MVLSKKKLSQNVYETFHVFSFKNILDVAWYIPERYKLKGFERNNFTASLP